MYFLMSLKKIMDWFFFCRPRHRYPVYDREGRGRVLYGYGGDEVYPYTVFDPVEGHHKK